LLTAQITGGLGNQLFTYARLATLVNLEGIHLQIDGSITERVLGRAPDLFDFNLMGEPQISANTQTWSAVQMERVLWRSKLTKSITRRHQEIFLGGSDISQRNLDGWKVRGFFQDFRVAEEFITTFGKSPFGLKNESPTLIALTDQVLEKSVVAIHVRRGDYLNYKDSFGLLTDEYYIASLQHLSEERNFSDVMIFSDSPELVVDLSKKIDIPTQVISPSELSTSETLVLMSRCAGLVTSNSTFSFWAGILGNDLKVVIPDPWFKSNDEWLGSADFKHPSWMKQPARWH
jgi:hypothetical protein